MNPFLDDKSARFNPLPTGLGAGLVPETDRLLRRVDRRPYILTAPLGAETPDFVQWESQLGRRAGGVSPLVLFH